MRMRRRALRPFVAISCALALGAPVACVAIERVWTDARGGRVSAHLVAQDGSRVRLDTGRQVLDVGEAELGEGDRAYLRARREAFASLARGVVSGYRPGRKFGATPGAYAESAGARKALDYFRRWHSKLERDPSGVERLAPDVAAALPLESQSACLRVPEAYDDSVAFACLVQMMPVDKGLVPRGWDEVLDARRVIYVCPDQVGNRRGEWERAVRALDALAGVSERYMIDPRRVWIGGFSGGGYMAFWIQMLWPEVFRGALNQGRDFPLEKVRAGGGSFYPAAMPFLGESDFRGVSVRGNRWAFLMGDRDPNWALLGQGEAAWKRCGFQSRIFAMSGEGHELPDGPTLGAALAWVEEMADSR